MISQNQKNVIAAIREYKTHNPNADSVTFRHLYNVASPGYYCNGEKHFRTLLTRMINRKLIVQVAQNRYDLYQSVNNTQEEINFGLFNNTQP